MGILLDSHVFMWSVNKPSKLGPKTQALIEKTPDVYISIASLWELTIKFYIGKFAHSPESLLIALRAMGYTLLNLKTNHLLAYKTVIAMPHKDPFDRVLITQARAEKLQFVTADTTLLALKLPFIIDARS